MRIRHLAATAVALTSLTLTGVVTHAPVAAAPAGDIFVDASAGPGGTGSSTDPYDTIQEAVDNADPGDVIIVRRGTYTEDVEIDDGLDGLIIRGRPGAVVDGDDTFTISDPNVTIEHLEISALDDAIRIGNDGNAPGATIQHNKITSGGYGVDGDLGFSSDDVTIRKNRISSYDYSSIDLDSSKARVEGNVIRSGSEADAAAIELTGNNGWITSNLIRGGNESIEVDGSNNWISRNIVVRALVNGIYIVDGDDNVVSGNGVFFLRGNNNEGATGIYIADEVTDITVRFNVLMFNEGLDIYDEGSTNPTYTANLCSAGVPASAC